MFGTFKHLKTLLIRRSNSRIEAWKLKHSSKGNKGYKSFPLSAPVSRKTSPEKTSSLYIPFLSLPRKKNLVCLFSPQVYPSVHHLFFLFFCSSSFLHSFSSRPTSSTSLVANYFTTISRHSNFYVRDNSFRDAVTRKAISLFLRNFFLYSFRKQ